MQFFFLRLLFNFQPRSEQTAKRETRRRSKSTSGCVISDVDSISLISQFCFHAAAAPLLPRGSLIVSGTEPSCLERWPGSSAVHEKCIYSLFFELFASDTHFRSYPCHVGVCINYVAGAVEETILMQLNEMFHMYHSPVDGPYKHDLIQDEKTL